MTLIIVIVYKTFYFKEYAVYQFERVNEKGRIELLEPASGLISCSYSNRFLGSCTFEARIIEKLGRNLKLDEHSVSVQDQQRNNGTEKALIKEATLFFKGLISGFRSVEELRQALRSGKPSTETAGWLNSLRILSEKGWKRTQATSLISTFIR